jgi:hypothetical protein
LYFGIPPPLRGPPPFSKGAGIAAGGDWGIPSIKIYNLNQYTTPAPTKKEQIVNFIEQKSRFVRLIS